MGVDGKANINPLKLIKMKRPFIKNNKERKKQNISKNLKEIIHIVNEALLTYKTETQNENIDISEFKTGLLKKRNGSNSIVCDGLKVYAVLARETTDYCWSDIGREAGERDHSTLLWHYRGYEAIYKTDKDFRLMANSCKVKVEELFNIKILKIESVVDKYTKIIDELSVNALQKLHTEYNG